LADKNPFIDRPRFRSSKDVKHAAECMPESDEELHRLCGWLIATGDPVNIIAAAQLMFMALTGQRSGEPGFLRWSAKYLNSGPQCGARFPRQVKGETAPATLLAVHRLKNGINPAVIVHPALASFLAVWEPYCRQRWPGSDFFFPHPTQKDRPLVLPYDQTDTLGWRLEIAAKALGLPKRKPHGMRAVYVRVRRSEGAGDGVIGDELGQSSGAALIISTYGKADQIRYDGRWDWLPSAESKVPIAWTLIGAVRQNIISL
jgi:integrase